MDALISQHHREQGLIARNVIAQLNSLWGILDFHDLHGTQADWLKSVRPVVEQGYLTSQYVAAQFSQTYRDASFPNASPLDLDFPNPLGLFNGSMIQDKEVQLRIMVSMKVTGPDWITNNTLGKEPDAADLMRRGFSKSSGAATRLTLSGGRNAMVLIAGADQLASGIERIVGDTACESCKSRPTAMDKTAGHDAMLQTVACHDFGNCTAAIIYEGINQQ